MKSFQNSRTPPKANNTDIIHKKIPLAVDAIGLANIASQSDGAGLLMEAQRMGLVPGPGAYLFEGDALVPGRTGRGISAGNAFARDRAARAEPLQHAKPTGWGMIPESSESVFARTIKHYAQFHRFVATASILPILWERVMAHPCPTQKQNTRWPAPYLGFGGQHRGS